MPKSRRRTHIDAATATKLQLKLRAACADKAERQNLPRVLVLDQLLKKHDKSKDGSLDAKELRQLIRRDLKVPASEVSDGEIASLVAALDDDGSGSLSVDEFADFVERGIATFNRIDDATAAKLQKRLKESVVIAGVSFEDLVQRYDKSGDGLLDEKELKNLIRKDLNIPAREVSDTDIASLVAALDDDGGGTLSLHELSDFVARGTATFHDGPASRPPAAPPPAEAPAPAPESEPVSEAPAPAPKSEDDVPRPVEYVPRAKRPVKA